MHANEELINRFYEAFAKRDAETMASCYHQNICFSDPVFPNLQGPAAGAMWRMLCEKGADLEIMHSAVTANDTEGSAHWDADYTLSITGRKVHNRIDARFRFEDGKIIEHTDKFNFFAWSRMALGLPGYLLGWTPLVRNKVRSQVAKDLKRYMADNNLG